MKKKKKITRRPAPRRPIISVQPFQAHFHLKAENDSVIGFEVLNSLYLFFSADGLEGVVVLYDGELFEFRGDDFIDFQVNYELIGEN